MRRWHRMLAPWFALLLLILAGTGLATQATDLLAPPPVKSARGGPDQPSAMKRLNRLIKHIHSGEELGPVGIALNIGGGVALLFFAGSGFWMYVSMWMKRRRKRPARR